MVDAPIVAVRGEVNREVPPEIARFSVTITASDKDRQTVLQRLSERSEAVRALIDSYGDAVEKRETGYLSVRPETKRSGERIVAYHGSVTTMVVVTDFAALGELMLRLADLDQSSVHGPWWELRPGSPVYREARKAAIADAITRAREYAEAVGSRVVRLVEISDSGLTSQPIMKGGMQFAARSMAMAEDAGPQLDLDPQQQTIFGSVEARFTISEPTGITDPVD